MDSLRVLFLHFAEQLMFNTTVYCYGHVSSASNVQLCPTPSEDGRMWTEYQHIQQVFESLLKAFYPWVKLTNHCSKVKKKMFDAVYHVEKTGKIHFKYISLRFCSLDMRKAIV